MNGVTARRARGGLVVLVVTAGLCTAVASSPAQAAAEPPAGPTPAAATTPTTPAPTGERRPVIVSFAASLAAPARLVASAAAASSGAVAFASGAGFVASLDDSQIAALRALPGIAAVTPNRVLEPGAAPHDQTGASVAWASGWRGDGRRIAIVDTGVDTTNPNLAGKVVAEACFTPRRDGAADAAAGDCPDGSATAVGAGAAAPCTGRSDCYHGTHVASVAAADGPDVVGTAPGATLVAVQVFTSVRTSADRVVTDEGSLVRALEWLEEQHRTQPIAAVNLSLGGGPVPTPCTASPALVAVIDRLAAAGVAVVASAGNDAHPSMLSFPACLPNVVSVAAEGATSTAAGFANSAPSLTLFAPGEGIVGAWGAPCCARVLSGSSFAAPQVAAAFALLRQQGAPGSVAELTALLRRTGEPVTVPGASGLRTAPTTALRLDRALDPRYQTPVAASLGRRAAPLGVLDVVDLTPAGVRVAGWALDPDSVVPVRVHVYVDGVLVAVPVASTARPDVATAYPGYGDERGFDLLLPVAGGRHTVCVYALDAGPGPGNVLLACRDVDVRKALGWLDEAVADAGVLSVRGWAVDAGQVEPVEVEVEVDGAVVARRAATERRPDVAAAHPAYGPAHGFTAQVPIEPGVHEVCVLVLDERIGCRLVEAVID